MIFELKGHQCTRYVLPTRPYIPDQRRIIQSEVQKLAAVNAIEPSISESASACHTVRKMSGTVRVVQDFRGFNASMKPQSPGLGD